MRRSSAFESKTPQCRFPWKGKLLLVDDDLGDLKLYSAILTQLGCEVRAMACFVDAADCVGREALD